MSNGLARSAHGLSLAEKRVVAVGLAKTDSMSSQALVSAAKYGWSVRITALEYAKEFDVSADAAYLQLKEAGDNLLKRQVRTVVETGKGLRETKINWCGQVVYHHGEGWIEIAFTHFIAPHLLALRTNFLQYKLKQTNALRSVYTWRLMEAVLSWRDKKTKVCTWAPSIDEFCHAMEVPDTYKGDFGQLRRRVIDPAIKELKAKNDMDIEWEARKSGRKVVGLFFTYKGVIGL